MQNIDQLTSIMRILVYIMWILPLFLIFLWFMIRQKLIKVSSEKEKVERTIQNLKISKFFYLPLAIIIILDILFLCKHEYYGTLITYAVLVLLPVPLILYLLKKFFGEVLKTL